MFYPKRTDRCREPALETSPMEKQLWNWTTENWPCPANLQSSRRKLTFSNRYKEDDVGVLLNSTQFHATLDRWTIRKRRRRSKNGANLEGRWRIGADRAEWRPPIQSAVDGPAWRSDCWRRTWWIRIHLSTSLLPRRERKNSSSDSRQLEDKRTLFFQEWPLSFFSSSRKYSEGFHSIPLRGFVYWWGGNRGGRQLSGHLWPSVHKSGTRGNGNTQC